MPARCPWFRSLLVLALLGAAILGTASTAMAEDLDHAQALLDGGETAKARAVLAAYLESDEERSAVEILQAAQLARALPDIELLRVVRGLGETLEGESEDSDPALDLALGFTYLGLAEENLRLRTLSRSISLYFADALARAENVPADSSYSETAARLSAGVRFAQGDLPGAVKGLDAYRAAAKEVSPRFDALHGRLTYEKAAGMPVTTSGHATPEAEALLKQAGRWLARASRSEELTPRQRRAAALREGYANHRLGAPGPAEAAYDRAFGKETRQARLVVRALMSLHARSHKSQVESLRGLRAQHGDHPVVLDALASLHRDAGAKDAVLVVAERRLAVAPKDPLSWYWAGRALNDLGIHDRALEHFLQGVKIDPTNLNCSFEVEQLARAALPKNPDATRAIYERLIALRPDDPYTRNNYGFVLRDLVSAHTEKLRGGLERVPGTAPEGTLDLLKRCAEVYAEAVARIDPAQDSELDEMTAWNLAGIINDYALIIHYFVDVQDAALAERQYMRALEMTDYGFKDTYGPNLHRLYRYVLTDVDHAWRWYRVAREAQYAIMAEARDASGALTLVPDERKRAAARRDMEAARARILQALAMDAKEDGLPWPPAEENGNDR